MPYPFYSNNQYYMQDLQNMREKIDRQMQQMQQLNQNQMQMQQPVPNVTQNFQIAPTPNNNNELESKYANNIDEVKNTFVMKTGLFINKDLTTLWVKNTNGNIRAFQLTEIIEMDERDKEIMRLNNQIKELQQSLQKNNSNNIEKENSKERKTNKKD